MARGYTELGQRIMTSSDKSPAGATETLEPAHGLTALPDLVTK